MPARVYLAQREGRSTGRTSTSRFSVMAPKVELGSEMHQLKDLEAEVEAKMAENRARSADRQGSDTAPVSEPVVKDSRLAKAASSKAVKTALVNGSGPVPAYKGDAKKVWVATDKVAEDQMHVVVWAPPPMMQPDLDAARKYKKKNPPEPRLNINRRPQGLTWEQMAAIHVSNTGNGGTMVPEACGIKREQAEDTSPKPAAGALALHIQFESQLPASQLPPPAKKQRTSVAEMNRTGSLPLGRNGGPTRQALNGMMPMPQHSSMCEVPQPTPPDLMSLLQTLVASGRINGHQQVPPVVLPPPPAYTSLGPPQPPSSLSALQERVYSLAGFLAQQGAPPRAHPDASSSIMQALVSLMTTGRIDRASSMPNDVPFAPAQRAQAFPPRPPAVRPRVTVVCNGGPHPTANGAGSDRAWASAFSPVSPTNGGSAGSPPPRSTSGGFTVAEAANVSSASRSRSPTQGAVPSSHGLSPQGQAEMFHALTDMEAAKGHW